jgi:hypothetical protein
MDPHPRTTFAVETTTTSAVKKSKRELRGSLIPLKETLEELRAEAGEQPGNQEELEGKAFVGPAGKLLNAALDEAGIDRQKA